MNTRSFFVVALAAMLVAPAATATWRAFGTAEPDSVLDTSTFMWSTEPPVGSKRVYFNTYTTIATVATTGINPNVAAASDVTGAGTGIEAFGVEEHRAILGIWTDCNLDGYVGMAESAVREYASVLLPANTPCAPVSSGTATCWTNPGPGNPCPNWPATGSTTGAAGSASSSPS